MTPKLSAFTPTDSSGRIADWVELDALLSPRGIATQATMVRAVSIIDEPIRDEEDEDLGDDAESEDAVEGGRDILNQKDELLVERVYNELAYRQEALGDRYPFTIDGVGQGWRLRRVAEGSPDVRFAQLFYDTCLVISGLKYGYLAVRNDDPLLADIPNHVQLMSYMVAADYVGGESFWMGWPRPDNTTKFRQALEKLVSRAEVGKLLHEDPEWDAGAAKDGSVDVIAWRSFGDHKAGKSILYGQVASGRNWRTKPLNATIDPFFWGWFQHRPSKERLFSIFIPFMQHEDCKPKRGQAYHDRLLADAQRDEVTFGIVFDRLRIAELATETYLRLERSDWSDAIDLPNAVLGMSGWTEGVLSKFRQSGAATAVAQS